MRRTLLVVLFAIAACAAFAQTFPAHPQGSAVYDGANLLSPDDERQLSDLAQRFMQDTGAPIVVATFPSLASVGANGMGIERYSTELFNRWHIGNNKANGGILLLVAKDDRKVRIELGRNWQHDYDAQAKEIDKTVIIPAFKNGDYAGGIVQGANALAGMAGSSGFQDPQEAGPMTAAFTFFGGCCCCALPVIVIFALVRKGMRRAAYGPRTTGYVDQNRYYDPQDPRADAAGFVTGLIVGEMMSSPPVDPNPYDSGPIYDNNTYDSSSDDSSGSFDSDSGFDSGDSGGGGDTGSW